jgi:hypothetical protein
MRNVVNPKKMYKNPGKFKIPEYSQVGTIVEGPTDFFSSRINNKERTRTMVEDTLASEARSGQFKSKFLETQAKKRSGRKEFYKKLLVRRKAQTRSNIKP